MFDGDKIIAPATALIGTGVFGYFAYREPNQWSLPHILYTTSATLIAASRVTSTITATAISSTATAITSTTTTTTTSKSTSTTTRTPLRCLINSDSATVKFDIIHRSDSSFGIRFLTVTDKSKATAATSITVLDDDGFLNGAELLKLLTQCVLVGVPCEATNKELRHLG